MMRNNEIGFVYPHLLTQHPPQRRQFGCINNFIHTIFCVANFCLLVIGAVLLILGAVNYLSTSKIAYEHYLRITPLPMMVVGSLLLVLAFLGCCGASKKIPSLLVIYGAILVVLLLVQVALSVYLFTNFNLDDLKTSLRTLFNTSTDKNKIIPAIQQMLECCGVNGPNDYQKNPNWPQSFLKFCCGDSKKCDVPAFKTGCGDRAAKTMSKYISMTSGIGVGAAAIELIGAVIAFKFASDIKATY